MPTYQYHCTACGYEFERFQKMSDPPVKTCPQCKGHTERIITGGAGFLLKGSGFYTTDYRSESYKAAEKKEKDIAAPKKPEKPDKKDAPAKSSTSTTPE